VHPCLLLVWLAVAARLTSSRFFLNAFHSHLAAHLHAMVSQCLQVAGDQHRCKVGRLHLFLSATDLGQPSQHLVVLLVALDCD
jgi:hypothetical protein